MSIRIELLGKWTEVPGIDNVTPDLDGLDILDLGDLFVLTDGSIVHSHLTGMLWLIELNHT